MVEINSNTSESKKLVLIKLSEQIGRFGRLKSTEEVKLLSHFGSSVLLSENE